MIDPYSIKEIESLEEWNTELSRRDDSSLPDHGTVIVEYQTAHRTLSRFESPVVSLGASVEKGSDLWPFTALYRAYTFKENYKSKRKWHEGESYSKENKQYEAELTGSTNMDALRKHPHEVNDFSHKGTYQFSRSLSETVGYSTYKLTHSFTEEIAGSHTSIVTGGVFYLSYAFPIPNGKRSYSESYTYSGTPPFPENTTSSVSGDTFISLPQLSLEKPEPWTSAYNDASFTYGHDNHSDSEDVVVTSDEYTGSVTFSNPIFRDEAWAMLKTFDASKFTSGGGFLARYEDQVLDEDNHDLRVQYAIHFSGKFRMRINFPSSEFYAAKSSKVSWDEIFFPAQWTDWKNKREAHDYWKEYQGNLEDEPENPGPQPSSRPSISTKTTILTGEWKLWSGAIYTPTSIPGELRICNMRAQTYETPWGSPPQYQGERYIPYDD